MNIPGFSADSSVYKTTGNYFKSRQGSVNNTAVIPQMMRTIDLGPGCTLFCNCNPASGACSCDATLCPFLPWGPVRERF